MTRGLRHRTRTTELLALARAHRRQYLADLAELVAIDSGSHSPAGVDKVADWVQERLKGLGFTVDRVRLARPDGHRTGDALVARKAGSLSEAEGGRRILLAAHMDTVFEDGTAAQRP